MTPQPESRIQSLASVALAAPVLLFAAVIPLSLLWIPGGKR